MKLKIESQTGLYLVGEQIVLQLRQSNRGGGTAQTVEVAFQRGWSCLLSLRRRSREMPEVSVSGPGACGCSLIGLCQGDHGVPAIFAILLARVATVAAIGWCFFRNRRIRLHVCVDGLNGLAALLGRLLQRA
jgi:hypothetical protein